MTIKREERGRNKHRVPYILTVPQSRAYKMTPQLQTSTSGPAYNLDYDKKQSLWWTYWYWEMSTMLVMLYVQHWYDLDTWGKVRDFQMKKSVFYNFPQWLSLETSYAATFLLGTCNFMIICQMNQGVWANVTNSQNIIFCWLLDNYCMFPISWSVLKRNVSNSQKIWEEIIIQLFNCNDSKYSLIIHVNSQAYMDTMSLFCIAYDVKALNTISVPNTSICCYVKHNFSKYFRFLLSGYNFWCCIIRWPTASSQEFSILHHVTETKISNTHISMIVQ